MSSYFRAPLTLEKSVAGSVLRLAAASSTSRRIDPAADLREATERNVREARDEAEADRLAKEQADLSVASAVRALAHAEAQAAEKERLAEAARRQEPLLVAPLNTAPPSPDFEATAGGAGGDYPIQERGGDIAMPDVFMPLPPPPPPPASELRDEQPVAPPVPPVETVVATVLVPAVRIPTRRYLEKAASAPRPQEIDASSSSALDTEATSAAPVGWVRGAELAP